jgi:hypothetical protein
LLTFALANTILAKNNDKPTGFKKILGKGKNLVCFNPNDTELLMYAKKSAEHVETVKKIRREDTIEDLNMIICQEVLKKDPENENITLEHVRQRIEEGRIIFSRQQTTAIRQGRTQQKIAPAPASQKKLNAHDTKYFSDPERLGASVVSIQAANRVLTNQLEMQRRQIEILSQQIAELNRARAEHVAPNPNNNAMTNQPP